MSSALLPRTLARTLGGLQKDREDADSSRVVTIGEATAQAAAEAFCQAVGDLLRAEAWLA